MRDLGIVDTSGLLPDVGEAAALISELDLVCGVDCGYTNFSDALGKETWVLVPWTCCPIRHSHRDPESSVWYPSSRLFRSQQHGRWDAPIGDMAEGVASGPATHATQFRGS